MNESKEEIDMPRGIKECPKCNEPNGARAKECLKCGCTFTAPQGHEESNLNETTDSSPPPAWEKPDMSPAVKVINKAKETKKNPTYKYDLRLASMFEEGIFTVDVEKLLACRKPKVVRFRGALCLVIDIFNEGLDKQC